MVRIVFATLMLAILSTLPSVGNAVENGTRVIVSDHSYWALIARLEAAIKRQKLRIISRASVRGAERQRKLGIPGNMVIGAFRDEYTARILRANIAAGIEAPIRFYITRGENEKTTTLWYRRPSWVLAPYGDESGELRAVATELDTVMETIVTEATKRPDRRKRLFVKRNKDTRKAVKQKAVKPAAREPAPRKPDRVVASAPAKPARTVKAKPAKTTNATKTNGAENKQAKPVKAALTGSETLKTLAVTKTKSAAPTPLAPKAPIARAAPKPLAGATPKPLAGATSKPRAAAGPKPKASAAPKPLTRADAATPRPIEAAPQQRAKAAAPEQTSGRPAAKAPIVPATKPKTERVTENKSIELSPLMLRLQGQ